MFINKITLYNFRIFKGKHTFDLSDKNIVIIEGPNGHGKSTIFDAMNWAISGIIPRYSGSNEYQQFNYIVNSTEYLNGTKEAYVELTIANSTESFIIKRCIKKDGSTKLFINNENVGVREGGNLITNKLLKDNKRKYISNLSTIIESNLILSQETLEEFIRGNKPSERYLKLEQILGLKKYGQSFSDYLKDLKKACNTEKAELEKLINIEKNKKEILKTEYNEKSLQYIREGNYSKDNILSHANTFLKEINILQKFKDYSLINNISIDEYNLFHNIEEDLNIIFRNIESYKDEIHSMDIPFSNNILDYQIKSTEKKIDNLNDRINKRNKGVNKITIQINNLEKLISNKVLLDNNKKNKLDIEKKIDEFENKILSISKNIDLNTRHLDTNFIEKFIETYNNHSKLLEQLRVTEIFLTKKVYLEDLTNKKENVLGNLSKTNKEINELNLKIKELDSQIRKLSNNKESKMLSYVQNIIQEIQIYIQDKNKNYCLVCGSQYDTPKDLQQSIKKQIEKSNTSISKLQMKINESKYLKEKAEYEYNALKIECTNYTKDENLLTQKIDNLKKELISIQSNNEIINDSYDNIRQKIINYENYINDYKLKYEIVKKIKILLNNKNNLYHQLSEINHSINDLEYINKNLNFNSFDEKQLKWKINISQNYKEKAIKEIETLKKEFNVYQNKLKILNYHKEKVIKIHQEVRLIFCNKNFIDNNINNLEISSILDQLIIKLQNHIKNCKRVLNDIGKYLNQKELLMLEENIKEYKIKIMEIENKLSDYNIKTEELDSLIDYHKHFQSSLINEYIDSISMYINKYFRQISPHSYCNYINLFAKKNELYILLSESKISSNEIQQNLENLSTYTNASLTLSAAQSTILAMSIFLALNETQNSTKLKLIAIDDPFQNLDDINVFSFIDVIDNLITTGNQQIFISTHDSDFSKLIRRKVNINETNCAYIKMNSYTKNKIDLTSEQYTYE